MVLLFSVSGGALYINTSSQITPVTLTHIVQITPVTSRLFCVAKLDPI